MSSEMARMPRMQFRDTERQLTARQSAGLQPETFDAESGSVRFVAATEKPTTVFDMEDLELIDEVLLMDGMQLPPGERVPLLNAHSRFQVDDVLGSATEFRQTTTEGYRAVEPLVTFSGVSKAQESAQLVREGHLTDVSVGYLVLERERIPKGESRTIRGRKYKGPMRVATKWELKEVSLTPIGADDLAKARGKNSSHGGYREDAMNKELRKFLERMGLDPKATEAQAKQYLDNLRAREDLQQETRSELEKLERDAGDSPDLTPIDQPSGGTGSGQGNTGHRSEPSGGSGGGSGGDGGQRQYVALDEVRGMIDDAVHKATQETLQNEYKRQDDIRETVRLAGYGSDVADEYIRSGEDVNTVRSKLFERMKTEAPPVGAGRISVGEHDQDKFRAAAVSGLLVRCGIREEKPAPGHEAFRAASIEKVARECLERMGVNTRSLASRDQVAREILKRAGSVSTDDFPSIFLDVANKVLLQAYRESPNTWRPWVNVVSASDFKDQYGVSLSEAPDLELVDQNGEFKHGSFSDKQESYALGTYGKIVDLTRQMIVNDDMRAFSRLPRLLGNAARRKEAEIVYSLLINNPTMSDGNKLFSSNHNNLGSNVGRVTSDRLASGRGTMRRQKGPQGAHLDLQPAILLTPTSQETDAEVLLRSATLPVSGANADYNPWANKLRPIAEPRLDDDSEDAWYLIADPNQVDTVEAAFLDGNEEPYFEEQQEFGRDAVSYKVRHDFGAGVMEWRGFFKNPGT